ncbi:MAG: pilin [Candidatus Marinimicrobia bacterium]|nr:pilin [Candidatus Neomarinimicrobiota bacterium]
MKTITRENKGFTLIELILVIVILGILAAVAIPKMSGLLHQARISTENAVINQIKTGLEQEASEGLITTGQWDYLARSTNILTTVMDDVPSSWTYATATGTITYAREDSTISWIYTPSDAGGAGRGSYTIVRQASEAN